MDLKNVFLNFTNQIIWINEDIVLYVNENLILVNSKEMVYQNRIVFDKIKDEIDMNKNDEPDVKIKI